MDEAPAYLAPIIARTVARIRDAFEAGPEAVEVALRKIDKPPVSGRAKARITKEGQP